MALDFQQVYAKIKEIGRGVQQRQKTLEARRAKARATLTVQADALETLRATVERIKAVDPGIRCALPFRENLDTHLPAPALPPSATLIAADGSQITPDRHAQIQYGLVNVGAIVFQLNSGNTPVLYTDSQLLFDDELYTANGMPLTDELVALQRDLQERAKLEELAKLYPAPVITFTDGPIELWGAKDGDSASAFDESLKKYLSVLSRLQERGVTTAGYVEKPAADLVVRLLELAEALPEEYERLREYHPLRGVTDRWLFGEKDDPLLKPGERSAVFAIQSKAEKYYRGVLALHFFYLNAGTEGDPWPVRVEIPRWVAEDPAMLGMLHAVLVAQCGILGVRPYPYLLLRAHETAVVTHDERKQVELLLLREIRERGGEMDKASNKNSGKEQLQGRRRF